MGIEVSFNFERDKEGKMIGFSLVAGTETYSEIFVENFAKGLTEKKASIKIDGDKVVFNHEGSEPLIFQRTDDEIDELKKLFADKSLKPVMKPVIAMNPGFRILFQVEI